MKRRIEIIAFETQRIGYDERLTSCPVCFEQTEFLTLRQAAAVLRVGENDVIGWLAQGKTHGALTPDGQQRICKKALLLPAIRKLLASIH